MTPDNGTLGQDARRNMAEGLYLMDGIKGLLSLPQHSIDMLLAGFRPTAPPGITGMCRCRSPSCGRR